MRREEPSHLRVEVHERDALHGWVLEDLADGQSIASTQHEYSPRPRQCAQARMHQRFVISIFVAGAELQVGVEKEAQVVLPCGQYDVLIPRVAREDHLVRIDALFGK